MKIDVWKPIDNIGFWIATWWSPAKQVRTGVILCVISLALIPYVFLAGEPPIIYLMSASALLLGGLGIVVTAVLAVKEAPDSDVDDLRPSSGKQSLESS